MSWQGAYDKKCEHPKCGRPSVSTRNVKDIGDEFVCEACGFRWHRDAGILNQVPWKRDPKKGWIPAR